MTYKEIANQLMLQGYERRDEELITFCANMLGETEEYRAAQKCERGIVNNLGNLLRGIRLGLRIALGSNEETFSRSTLLALLSSADEPRTSDVSDFERELTALSVGRILPQQKTPDGKSRMSREELYMRMTELVSLRSTCLRAKVGALIVKDGRPISMGYNGAAAGLPHCQDCEGPNCSVALHAEANAIAFAAKAGVSITGSDLYCTMSPCISCAKMIINSGIARVYYKNEYRVTTGIDLLKQVGILTIHLEDYQWNL